MPLPTGMHRFLYAFMITFVVVGLTEARAQQLERPHSLEAGAWALQFGVGENFTLSSFLRSAVSVKKHISPGRAWQVGLTVDARLRFSERTQSSVSTRGERGQIAVVARYLSYPLLDDNSDETVHLFVGAGPTLHFDRTGHQDERPNRPTLSSSQTAWGVGVSGVIGAEWFLHPRISVSGIYEAALLYEREGIDEPADDAITRNRIELGTRGVGLGVSAYF